uniref:Uncharacterized protein n=1 Tax=Haemonchus contortus TaxID=6289 RepID=W6ND35_HAECO
MDWSVKPQRANPMRTVTVKKKKATCMRSISSRTQETSRSHDRYLHGDADVGLMSKSQVKKVFKEAMKVQPGNIESRLSEGEPNADEEEEEAVTEEGSINLVNISTQSTIEQSLDPGARVGLTKARSNATSLKNGPHTVRLPPLKLRRLK